MRIIQTLEFARTVKKLPEQQKQELDKAVQMIIDNPETADLKTADLAGIRVHKFKMNKQFTSMWTIL